MGARYMECSSKEMDGVDEIFEKALDIVVSNDRSNVSNHRHTDSRASVGNFGGGSGGDGLVIKRKKRKCNFL